MKHYIFTLLSLFLSCSLFASASKDFSTYKAGDSLEWFYAMHSDAIENPSKTQSDILNVLKNSEVSDEAFSRACEILKPIASAESVDVLKKYLNDEFRSPWVCDVFRTLPSSDVDEALIEFLKNAKGKSAANAISVLADRRADFAEIEWYMYFTSPIKAFGGAESCDIIAVYALSDDKCASKAATVALGKFADKKAVDTLSKILSSSNDKKDLATEALCGVALRAIKKGDKQLAKDAMELVPADCSYAIAIRGKLSDNPLDFYDSLLISNNPNMKYAARCADLIRTFEGSEKLLANMDKLSDEAKTYAIGSMTMTNDCRFFKYIAPYMTSTDYNLKCAAVYAARFLCADKAEFEKIYNMCTPYDTLSNDYNIPLWNAYAYGEKDKMFASIAAKVMLENNSWYLQELLKEKSSKGDFNALMWLIMRNDENSKNILWQKFYSGGFRDANIVKAVEHTITFGDLKQFASKMQKDGKSDMDKVIANILVNKFQKSNDSRFTENELDYILWGALDFESNLYKEICTKLKIDKRRKVGLQLSTFYNMSFYDCLPLVKATGISHLGLTGQLIGGKYPNVKTGHNMDTQQRKYLRELLDENSFTLVSYGVRSPETEKEIKEICEFVKEFSIPVVLTESPENMFPIWDKYAAMYNIKVAVHNHPKPEGSNYRYCEPDYLNSIIRKYPNIYSCADNGHWVRGGVNAIKAFKIFDSKVGVVHIKDVDVFGTNAAKDVQLGKGCAQIKESLEELDRQKFDGYFLIEHEVWGFTTPEKTIEEIRENSKYIKQN